MSTPTATLIPTGTWAVDAAHSNVEFQVKHMGIASVRGRFTSFEGAVEVPEDITLAKVTGSIDVASLDTNEAQRDEHLRSPDFFDVESFPKLTFQSTRIEAVDEDTFRITGSLSLHGVTREVTLEAVVQGTDTDPWGNDRVGPGGRRPAQPGRLRHEVQPGARQRQRARLRQGQALARRVRRQAGLARNPKVGAAPQASPPPRRPPGAPVR